MIPDLLLERGPEPWVILRVREEERQPWKDLLDRLSQLPEVLEVHLFPPMGPSDLEEVWVVVRSPTPRVLRKVTDMVADVELERDALWEISIVARGDEVPPGANVSLTRLGGSSNSEDEPA